MNIAAIMPCRGRAEQTVRNVRRLLATAGCDEWTLLLPIDRDRVVEQVLLQFDTREQPDVLPRVYIPFARNERGGYWRVLKQAQGFVPDATHLINLANDLIPGQHWLRRAVEGYQTHFGEQPGMLGFNGDSWAVEHSCHFLISRTLLERYGGWPVWYDHNFGDTELCQRAIADGVYAKAPWALLFHDHPYFGGDNDGVYAEGRARADTDERLYLERKRLGWPAVPSARG